MEPVHIFYRELPADKNNIFAADIAEKNEVKNITLKKFQEYAVTGLSIRQEIGLELVTVADVNKLYNLSNSIQNPVKEISNLETKDIIIPFQKISVTCY